MSETPLTPYQQRRAEKAAQKAAQADEPKAGSHWFPKEVRAARTAERNRRNVEVRRRATMILIERHKAEYDEIAALEAKGLLEERGPLPGDPGYEG